MKTDTKQSVNSLASELMTIFIETAEGLYSATEAGFNQNGKCWDMRIDGVKFDGYLTLDVFDLIRDLISPQ